MRCFGVGDRGTSRSCSKSSTAVNSDIAVKFEATATRFPALSELSSVERLDVNEQNEEDDGRLRRGYSDGGLEISNGDRSGGGRRLRKEKAGIEIGDSVDFAGDGANFRSKKKDLDDSDEEKLDKMNQKFGGGGRPCRRRLQRLGKMRWWYWLLLAANMVVESRLERDKEDGGWRWCTEEATTNSCCPKADLVAWQRSGEQQ